MVNSSQGHDGAVSVPGDVGQKGELDVDTESTHDGSVSPSLGQPPGVNRSTQLLIGKFGPSPRWRLNLHLSQLWRGRVMYYAS